MKKIYSYITIVFLIVTGCSNVVAQTPVNPALANALQSKIDGFISQYSIPGVSVAVLYPGNQFWYGAAGLSNIHTMVEMDTSHLFQMASVNKMYVAAMIFQMREQGLISLDDTVGKFLPPMTNVPSNITISNLLQHKSGLFDVASDPTLFNKFVWFPDSIWPHLLTIETFVDEPIFPQGDFFGYSNTNYILLGMIIEQITGNTFATELRNRFCVPYGLTQTFFEPDDSVAGPQTPGWTSFTQVGVYDTDAKLILNDCSASIFFSSGSIVAKPADVVRFTKLLWSGQIINDSSLNLMKQCTNVNFGQGCDGYGYGTMRYQFGGKTYYGHAGDINGFTQISIYQQEDSVGLTISVNRNNAPRGSLATDILALIDQFLITSIDETKLATNNISVYPNPATSELNIVATDLKIESIIIYNTLGDLINTYNVNNESNIKIDIKTLSTGVYFINFKGNKEGFVKFIKE